MIEKLVFLEPWVLTALALLPLLWRFLRVTPPAPKRVFFPAIFLLQGLTSTENTPAAMPPWLIILRIVAVIMLILGLAHPIFDQVHSHKQASEQRVMVMLFDNSWGSAGNWQQHIDTAHDIIDQAQRDQQDVILLTTATDPNNQEDGRLAVSDARARLDSLAPQPWPADALDDALPKLETTAPGSARVVWLHSGVASNADAAIAERLKTLGSLEIFLPSLEDLAVIVPPQSLAENSLSQDTEASTPKTNTQNLVARVIAAAPAAIDRFNVAAIDDSGRTLALAENVIAAGQSEGEAVFDLPQPLAQRVSTLRIEGQRTAASVLMLDGRWQRRLVAVAGQPERQQRPLIDEDYYLERALSFGHDVIRQPLDQLLGSPATTIILTDQAQPTAGQAAALVEWVKDGGMLIRFSGSRLGDEKNAPLLPVEPRRGERALGGALSWDQPMALGSFDAEGPFSDLAIPDDVVIRRQILAEPAAMDPDTKIWARLADGTPLVTARRLGAGWTVLFHVTAGADWSNLPLSGVFVDMLGRLTKLSKGSSLLEGSRPLPPWRSLDGWGQLTTPPAGARPLNPAADPDQPIIVSPNHPPGYYGDKTARQALNLGPSLAPIKPPGSFPEGTTVLAMAGDGSTAIGSHDFKAPLLVLALVLLCVDTLATLYLRGFLTSASGLPLQWPNATIGTMIGTMIRRKTIPLSPVSLLLIGSLLMGGLIAGGANASLAAADKEALAATLSTRLAFIRTGNLKTDRLSQEGLQGLSRIINNRSTVQLGDPVGINPDLDDLSFFPLIYWPITDPLPELAPAAIDNLNRFMALGGTIVFDTQDGHSDFSNRPALRQLADRLQLPPLVPLAADHVLNRSFYLIDEAPGRWAGGTTWVQDGTGTVNDSISPVIIGTTDWAAAWAQDKNGQPLYPVSPGGERQRERAYRFGVNLAMYILTGNYKSDQVHVPAILERLSQ